MSGHKKPREAAGTGAGHAENGMGMHGEAQGTGAGKGWGGCTGQKETKRGGLAAASLLLTNN